MQDLVFWIAFVALLGLGIALFASILRPERRIWPPPGRQSWQYWLIWILIDVATLGILVVGVLGCEPPPVPWTWVNAMLRRIARDSVLLQEVP